MLSAMKWHYNVLIQQIEAGADPRRKAQELIRSLSQFGDDGWELAGVIPWGAEHVVIVFKRPQNWAPA
jgi:hypothetical protein